MVDRREAGRILDSASPRSDTESRRGPENNWEDRMTYLRAWCVALFRSYSRATDVRGGSGHYNEQCHPQTYG